MTRSDGNRFVNVAPVVGWTGAITAPMGIDAADIDRDGRLDYFIGDGGQGMLLVSSGADIWVDGTAAAGITTPNGWGLGFEDGSARVRGLRAGARAARDRQRPGGVR